MSTTSLSPLYRLYLPDEVEGDGYPAAWHQFLKHDVRERAGHRCVRCGHPYRTRAARGPHDLVVVTDQPEWSRCDERCTHSGELRVTAPDGMVDVVEAFDSDSLISFFGDGYRVEARWRVLTVHHLDGDKANCRWWNLAALDQRCHLEIQGRVRMERRWLTEHSPWFRPYAAGYYAYVYLGEDLSPEQTMERLPELLDLEHRQESLI